MINPAFTSLFHTILHFLQKENRWGDFDTTCASFVRHFEHTFVVLYSLIPAYKTLGCCFNSWMNFLWGDLIYPFIGLLEACVESPKNTTTFY